jgi:formamidopyrimidine-DNA glycosylase
VETVRDGLARWVVGRTVASVEVRHPRAVRRHLLGAADLGTRLAGARISAASRRGKYLWLPLESAAEPDSALVAHLGMSGQLLVRPADAPDERHLHVRIRFTDAPPGGADTELRFVDQRTFGGLMLDQLVPALDRPDERLPAQVQHIARDPLDPHFDDALFSARLRRRDSAIKRALLDQSLISGVGNIYADEALWRTPLHYARNTKHLKTREVDRLLGHIGEVMHEALAQGGTSFDALYVNVNGTSGYFDRSLQAYGQEGKPCLRCGTTMRRTAFMNRSSFWCPACQPRPRNGKF